MYCPWWEWIDEEDGSMSCHWYMMNMDRCGFIGIWCIVAKMYRWLIIVLSWLIRFTNVWTQKWSPYGEIPHKKMLCGLTYPRSMVRELMINCGIMRWRSVKLSEMDSACHAISGGMWNITQLLTVRELWPYEVGEPSWVI